MNPYIIPGIRQRVTPDKHEEKIIDIICAYKGVSLSQLKVRSRKRERVLARQLIVYFLKRLTPKSLKAIGKIFDQDHTTIIHSVNTIEDLMQTDPSVRYDAEYIDDKIREAGIFKSIKQKKILA